MRLCIFGSRGMLKKNAEILIPQAAELARLFPISEEVCGMATGADAYGAQWAIRNNIPVKYFPADWKGLGKGAGYARNTEMAEYCDVGLAFHYGNSRGTAHMIRELTRLKKDCFVVLDGDIKQTYWI